MARNGWSAAHYHYFLPAYDRLLSPRAHVIAMGHIRDISPDGSAFRASPPALTFKDAPPGLLRWRPIIDDYRLEFAFNLASNLIYGPDGAASPRKLRLRPGPVRMETAAEQHDSRPEPEAWEFLLRSLRGQASAPVAFVYAPQLPRIEGNGILRTDADADMVAAFAEACHRNGVKFLDLTDRFVRFHDQTGRFPCGFHNGMVSSGHWNANGHRIVAEGILDLLRDIASALHAD